MFQTKLKKEEVSLGIYI